MVHARTIRPGELTTEQIANIPTTPEGMPERVAAAVTREAFMQLGKGGGRGQWAAIVLVAVALVWHVMGDGTVREEAKRTRGLVVWLVQCEISRQNGDQPPPLPLDLL